MKKFTIISSYLPSVLSFRGQLLKKIQEKGYKIHILAPDIEMFPDSSEELSNMGFFLHKIFMQRTGVNPFYDLITLINIYITLKKINPDYVLAYAIKPVIYGGLSSWLANVPSFFALIPGLGYLFQNVDNLSSRSLLRKTVHRVYAFALNKSDKIFFQNKDDLTLFRNLNLILPAKSVAIVNGSGVSVSEYSLVPYPRDEHQRIKVSFLLIARLLIDKGIREYIKAAREIRKEYPNIEFNLVGWIDKNPSAISKYELDELIQEGIINYWGRLNDVRPAITNCSVYVLPSYREGTPRSVLEAMSMGRAIITTDAPGCKETVVDGENGFLVDVKSVDSLIIAMKKFIDNPNLVEVMGARSRLLALEK